ncbi:uncharacterized protein EV422DRAFT_357421 [Fimicolochytrium jonesii]|uniref:uncharacterized protein n=1 Tax=Fimicolochytrium jonesii TaxID=1396493 RepID=UPI0022FF3AD8|nr:uncharacterized protein EV422DRAFT_357421 [Fimicolochytrium jonesii]KAI8823486.1 hypothetical protein EV422DRAFT_357421 [Fimicolochytrium jonesii]
MVSATEAERQIEDCIRSEAENARTAGSRLPPEILFLIFEKVRQRAAAPVIHQTTFAACTLVCRHWYEPARQSLWMAPLMSSKERTMRFLKRHLIEMEHGPGAPEPDDTDFLHRLVVGCRNLQSLKMFCDPLDPRTLALLMEACPNIRSLTLTGSCGTGGHHRFYYQLPSVLDMDERSIKKLQTRIATLHTLDLANMDFTRGDGVYLAAILVSGLGDRLEAFAPPMVTGPATSPFQSLRDDTIVAQIARQCPRLTHLCLRGKYVTDRALHALATWCPRLRALDLRYCPAVTSAGVLLLLTACQCLTDVRVGGSRANDYVVKTVLNRADLLRMLTRGRRRGSVFSP